MCCCLAEKSIENSSIRPSYTYMSLYQHDPPIFYWPLWILLCLYFQRFSMHLLSHVVLGISKEQIHKSRIGSLNSRCWNYNCQQLFPPAKASSGFKRYKVELQAVYSFATGRNLVGTSPTCWRHEILKYLTMWLDPALLVTTPLKWLKNKKNKIWSCAGRWNSTNMKRKTFLQGVNAMCMTRTSISSTVDYKRRCKHFLANSFTWSLISVRQTTCWWDLISVDFQLFMSNSAIHFTAEWKWTIKGFCESGLSNIPKF